MNSRRSGRARANQGRSHRLYWGEKTLLVSRNSTTSGKPKVHLGKSGCRRARATQTRTLRPTNPSSESTLTTPGDHEQEFTWCRRVQTTNHMLSQSTCRAELNRKKVDQERGAAMTNGRFTSPKANPAQTTRDAALPLRPSRIRAKANGTTRKPG